MVLKIFNYLRLIFIISCLAFSFYASEYYSGSKIIFLIFNVICLVMLLNLTSEKSSFFSFFLSFYLFMGFWFKYNLSLVINNGYVFDSGSLNSSSIDHVLLISIYIFLTVIVANFLGNKFFYYNKFQDSFNKNFSKKFYGSNKYKILIFFIISFISIAFINYYFKIYIKGFIFEHNINPFFSSLFKWIILFGFSTFSCFLLKNEIIWKGKTILFVGIIAIFEIFFSYTSMFSRSMLLFCIPFLYALIFYENKIANFKKNFFFLTLIFVVLSFISTLFSNELRRINVKNLQVKLKDNFVKDEINVQNAQNFNFQLNEIVDGNVSAKNLSTFVIINRWTGIDSLINVSSSKILGFDLLFKAFKEEKSKISNTFYENTFNLENKKPYFYSGETYVKGNTLPGLFTFLFYSGSITFLLLITILLVLTLIYLEKKLFILTNNNLFYVSFFSHYINFRIFSFGYAPKDSYLFIFSIFLSILVIYLLENDRVDKILSNLK